MVDYRLKRAEKNFEDVRGVDVGCGWPAIVGMINSLCWQIS